MENISLAIAFSAGFLSFLSPCVLPLIPAYISYLTGSAISEINTGEARINVILKSLGFVSGFSLVFIIMGASITTLGQFFTEYNYILKKIGSLVIILMGIHMTGLLKFKFLYKERRFLSLGDENKALGALFIGMAFAAGWTPCIGPILAAILIYASSMTTIWDGILLLTIYSLGLAIPFLLTALAIGSFSTYFRKISKYLPAVSIASGILLILTGLLIFTDKLQLVSSL